MTSTITLTGIKPTGELHLGNYLAAIRPLLAHAAAGEPLYVFIADLHALNGRPDPAELRRLVRHVAAAFPACGLDPEQIVLFRQSDVPAIAQMSQLLSNLCAKGTLNRAHAYKTAVADNQARGRDVDHGVNMGLYGYPVLMAADVLSFAAEQVPVGRDQAQHLEIAADLADAFARAYRPGLLPAPRALVDEQLATLPGLDGRKMSKSYGNTIPLFATARQTEKLVARIVTDSRTPEQPKNPDGCTLITLLRAFAAPDTVQPVEARYQHGGIGYGEVKRLLAAEINAHLQPARDRYQQLLADPRQVDGLLEQGADRARRRADRVLAKTMRAMGLR
jgi:tryptophanyl-tRNA synthetase